MREASPAQADNDGMRSAAGGLPIGEAYAHAQGLAHAYAQRSGDEVEHGEAMSRERTMSPVMQAHNLAPHQQQLGAKRKVSGVEWVSEPFRQWRRQSCHHLVKSINSFHHLCGAHPSLQLPA